MTYEIYSDGKVYSNNTVIGEIIGDSYHTNRNSSVHFFKKFQSYGIGESVLSMLSIKKVRYITITENGSVKLLSNIEDWINSDLTYTNTLNGESDKQKHLKIISMKRIGELK